MPFENFFIMNKGDYGSTLGESLVTNIAQLGNHVTNIEHLHSHAMNIEHFSSMSSHKSNTSIVVRFVFVGKKPCAVFINSWIRLGWRLEAAAFISFGRVLSASDNHLIA